MTTVHIWAEVRHEFQPEILLWMLFHNEEIFVFFFLINDMNFSKSGINDIIFRHYKLYYRILFKTQCDEPWLRLSSYRQSCRWRSWGNLCWGISLLAATHQRKASSQWSPPDCWGQNTQTHGCQGTEDALKHRDNHRTHLVWIWLEIYIWKNLNIT